MYVRTPAVVPTPVPRSGATSPQRVIRLGRRAWHALISTRFANRLLIAMIVAGLAGTVIRQFRATALTNPDIYASELALNTQRYGDSLSAIFERVGLYHVFTTAWWAILVVLVATSVVGNTLERVPRTWRDVHSPPVKRARRYFHPLLKGRTDPFPGVGTDRAVLALTAAGYRCRLVHEGTSVHLFAERNRWTPFASLVSHGALVLFVIAMGILTPRFGFEEALKIPVGDVRPVGAPGAAGNLLVKNEDFTAAFGPAGKPTEFATTLSIFRDGQEIARKQIRVNDPLAVDDYSFHENFYGPAVELDVRDPAGRLLWSGPVVLDGTLDGKPEGQLAVPGTDVTIELLLAKGPGGIAELTVVGLRAAPASATGPQVLFEAMLHTGEGYAPDAAPIGVEFRRPSSYIGLIVKRDPGQGLVWLGAVLLVGGLTISLGLPRRRIWGRIEDGSLSLAFQSDAPFAIAERRRILARIAAVDA